MNEIFDSISVEGHLWFIKQQFIKQLDVNFSTRYIVLPHCVWAEVTIRLFSEVPL